MLRTVRADQRPAAIGRNRCEVSMTVSIKRGKTASWELAAEYDEVVSGHDIEVVANCSCRAAIDIKPDRGHPIATVDWGDMTFAPEYPARSRVKVAYYRPRKIRRRTEVEFKVRARCRCADCLGEDEKTFVLIFDETLR